jgi:DEAD/DEAH box helicase domain-containing protein
MSERRDLGHSVGDSSATWSATVGAGGGAQIQDNDGQRVDVLDQKIPFNPTIYVYDNYPGGIGLSQPLFEMQGRTITAAIDLVNGCECAFGCPACIGPILAVEQSGDSSPKQSALRVLRLLTSG